MRRVAHTPPTQRSKPFTIASVPVHIDFESDSEDKFYISNTLDTLLSLYPSIPSDDDESKEPKNSNKESCDVTRCEKTNKLVSSLTLTLLILEVVENLVFNNTPTLSGYS